MLRLFKLFVTLVAFVLTGAAHAQSTQDFNAWKAAFRNQALSQGIPPQVFDAAFKHVRYDADAGEDDANQPEFVRPIWEYMDDAVSKSRVSTGRRQLGSLRNTLNDIQRKYGVDAATLLAIWGMETSYGSFLGSTHTIDALANAAFNGRRLDFAQSELMAALQILKRGDVSSTRMVGGWSGAMGHTQFMPTTYLRYAVDHNRDGKRDVWSSNPADALASAANYMRELGWDKGAPWGGEVTLPRGFDYALIGEYDTHNVNFWNARGVRQTSGDRLDDHGPTAVIAPAGANGPAFAIYPNFQVIRRYNMSVSYSLAVGHLSDRIVGGAPLTASWPRGDTPMTRAEQRELQAQLHKRGFDVGEIDGMIGPKTIGAIQAYQISEGIRPDGYATVDILKALRP